MGKEKRILILASGTAEQYTAGHCEHAISVYAHDIARVILRKEAETPIISIVNNQGMGFDFAVSGGQFAFNTYDGILRFLVGTEKLFCVFSE